MDEQLHGPDGLRVDRATRQAWVGREELQLSRTLFDILVALLEQRGRVVKTADLVRSAWGYDDPGDVHFVRTAVYRLRQRLRDAGADVPIEAVRGVGFRIGQHLDAQSVEARLARELALETATTAIFVLNTAREIVWANDAATTLTGYSVGELRSLSSSADLSPPGQRDLRYRAWLDVLSGKHLRRRDVDVLRKDGSRVSAGASWKPLRNATGEVEFAVLEFWSVEATLPNSEHRAAG